MRHFIPIVNRVAYLLPAALAGCRALWPVTTIIDNRDRPDERGVDLAEIVGEVAVYTPPVPLTTAQTMNLMFRLSAEQGLPYFTWQHLDAVCLADTAERLPDLAHDLLARGEPWGVLLTRSALARPHQLDGVTYRAIATDSFAAFNTAALRAVGGWDWVRFPFYVLDSDLYVRLQRAGFPVVHTELPVDHVRFSQTLRADPERDAVAEAHWPLWRQLFSVKHGAAFWEYRLYS